MRRKPTIKRVNEQLSVSSDFFFKSLKKRTSLKRHLFMQTEQF